MGRPDNIIDASASNRFHLYRLKLHDGDYDNGGAYWGGGGDPLWHTFDHQGNELFCRARNRSEAKNRVRESLPNAKFFK